MHPPHTDRLDDLGLDRVLLTLALFFLTVVILTLTPAFAATGLGG